MQKVVASLRTIRLHKRMMLFSVVVPVCIAICIAMIFSVTSNRLVLQKTREYVSSNTHHIKVNFDSYLGVCLNSLNALATNTTVIQAVNNHNRSQETGDWSAFSPIQDKLYWAAREIPGLAGLEISGLHSTITYNTRPVTTGLVSNSEFLQATLSSPQRITSFGFREMESPLFISNAGRNALVLGVQIKSHINGKVVGAVVVALSGDYLRDRLMLTEDVSGSSFVVLDGDERVVASTYTGGEWTREESAQIRTLNGEGLFSLHDKAYLVCQLPVEPLGWRVVSLTNYQGVTLAFLRNYILAMLLSLALAAFLVFCNLWVSRSVTLPIDNLLQTMSRTDYASNRPQAAESGNDELTSLCRTFNEMSVRIQDLLLQMRDAYEKRREAEYLALQSQINPHLLYNTLDSINWMAFTTGNDEICKTIQSLSTFFRLSLNKGAPLTTLGRELEQVECYVNLQKLQYSSTIRFRVSAAPDLLACTVPKIVLQPIVENSLMHGFVNDSLALSITAERVGDDALIQVEDNGSGIPGLREGAEIPVSQQEAGMAGYGLRNIDERIKLYFGAGYGLTLYTCQPHGLRVCLRVPYHLEEGDLPCMP